MENASTARVGGRTFSAVSSVEAIGPRRYLADIDPEWTIGGKPNGGYLLALLGRASASKTEHAHVITASAQFLRSPSPGSAVIEVEVLREGRSASQLRVWMTQEGERCVEALVTRASLDPSSGPRWSRWLPEEAPLAIDECVRLTSPLPDGRDVAIIRQVDLRLEPDTIGFRTGRPSGRGELRGWLTLPGGEDFDTTSLLYAVDALPAATFDVEYTGWVPTIELTGYVRALPAPGPVRIVQRAQLVDAGRVDEVCYVWDTTGRLVAQGMQLAGVRLP